MIEQRPKGPRDAAAEGRPPMSRRDARQPLTLTVRYRGGSEAWWEVQARGQRWRFPGYLSFHDVMSEVLSLER